MWELFSVFLHLRSRNNAILLLFRQCSVHLSSWVLRGPESKPRVTLFQVREVRVLRNNWFSCFSFEMYVWFDDLYAVLSVWDVLLNCLTVFLVCYAYEQWARTNNLAQASYLAQARWVEARQVIHAQGVAQTTSSIVSSEHLAQARRVSLKRDSAEVSVPGFRALA